MNTDVRMISLTHLYESLTHDMANDQKNRGLERMFAVNSSVVPVVIFSALIHGR
jgi:hypothetical protein